MLYYPRHIEDYLQKALSSFPVILLTGPRQVGKTTLLQKMKENDRRYVTLDDLNARIQAKEDPALFIQRYPPPVIIDEIQYAPDLLSYIKIEVDKNRENNLYWLTGSQHFSLMKNITESLAGRIGIINLLGFSWREKERAGFPEDVFLPSDKLNVVGGFDSKKIDTLFNTIWGGGFPALVSGRSKDWALYHSSYLQTYVQRDVRNFKNIGNLEQFTRFIRACAAHTGQVLNISSLANDTDISVKTARSWLSVLEAGFQIFLLRPYFSNKLKRLIKAPKLYFLDTGFCCYLTGWDNPESLLNGAMAGPLFETFIFTEILKRYWNLLKQPSIYYFRDRSKNEIDFVIEKAQKLYPVEVKLSAAPRKDWIRSFKKLGDYAYGCVVCQVEAGLSITDKTEACSWTAI